MKIYTKIVYDKDDNIIEEHSYNYNGPVAQAKFRSGEGPGSIINKKKRKAFLNNDNNYGFLPIASGRGQGNVPYKGRGQGNVPYKGRGQGNIPYKGRGQGNIPYKGRGTGTYDDTSSTSGNSDTIGISDAQKSHNYNNGKRGTNTYVHDISDPNRLYDWASYNALFTLSALSEADLKNPKTLLYSRPHDIIIRSAGIGPSDNHYTNQDTNNPNDLKNAGSLSKESKKIVNDNKSMKEALERSKAEFRKNNDMYFRSVEMNCLPPHNDERRLTSVTKIYMEIVEPWGITLLERIKAAAANNGYLDHLDAVYLLTLNFVGWDEKGMPIPPKDGKSIERKIPIKLVNMELDLSQGGTVYQVTAIPKNEDAYMDTYNYVRTAGKIVSERKKTYGGIIQELENILNKQVADETKENLNEKPDKYFLSIDDIFNPDGTSIEIKNLEQLDMLTQADTGVLGPANLSHNAPDATSSRTGPAHLSHNAYAGLKYMEIKAGDAIITILDQIMKSHPEVNDDKFKKWKAKVEKTLSHAQATGGDQGVFEASKAEGMHFISYRIKSNVIPTKEFDEKRKVNVKEIYYTIEPFKIHAYSLAIPGVSTGQNFKNFVYKTYNYLFTGENVDIIDLNINYKVAYFSAQLKKIEDVKKLRAGDNEATITGKTDAKDRPEDQTFILRSQPGMAHSGGLGRTGEPTTALDQFMDYMTHPKGDMIVVKMEILGDPAWISQSQFMPPDPMWIAPGTSEDQSVDLYRSNRNYIWNDELRCFNTDFADPVILLNYRMPTDINDKEGTYELQNTQTATFSGLYRVFQIDHNFIDGKYTNVLHMARFNNQGVSISNPYTEYKRYTVNGETIIGSKAELKKGNFNADFFDDVVANINSKVEKVKKGIGKAMIAKAKKKLKT